MAELQGNITNDPQGSMEEQDALKNRYTSDNIKLFFDTVTDDSVSFQSQITDNYVENNTAIQDHIAISPITVTLHGLCGEKVYTVEEAYNADYEMLVQQEAANELKEAEILRNRKLYELEVYVPQFSNATALAKNILDLGRATALKAMTVAGKIYDRFNPSIDQQFTAYAGLDSNLRNAKIRTMSNYLKDAWQSRKAYVVNTPFGIYDNMYIQSVTLHQGNENYICELDVTLKQLRFSDVTYTEADKEVLAKYNQLARAQEQNGGQAKGVNSVLYNNLTPDTEYINR